MANQKDKSLQTLEQRLLKRNTGMNFNQLSKTLDVEQQRQSYAAYGLSERQKSAKARTAPPSLAHALSLSLSLSAHARHQQHCQSPPGRDAHVGYTHQPPKGSIGCPPPKGLYGLPLSTERNCRLYHTDTPPPKGLSTPRHRGRA